jgi:hypothetical protein
VKLTRKTRDDDEREPYTTARVIVTIQGDIRKRTGLDIHVDEHNAVEAMAAAAALLAALGVPADEQRRT